MSSDCDLAKGMFWNRADQVFVLFGRADFVHRLFEMIGRNAVVILIRCFAFEVFGGGGFAAEQNLSSVVKSSFA
jgi:hypothetical protein